MLKNERMVIEIPSSEWISCSWLREFSPREQLPFLKGTSWDNPYIIELLDKDKLVVVWENDLYPVSNDCRLGRYKLK